MPTPGAQDVFNYLERFNAGLTTLYSLPGTFSQGATVITNVDTTNLSPGMSVAGAGIQAETTIYSVNGTPGPGGSINITKATTQAGSPATLAFTFFSAISEAWLVDARDNFVIPYVANKLKMSYQGVQTITKYMSGNGGSILVLPHRPIVDLISISYTNVVANQYYISPMAIQIVNDEGVLKARANFNEANYTPIFARGERNLRVIYTVGGTDFPGDVARVIKLIMAERALGHIANRTGGGPSLNVQGFGRNFGTLGKFGMMRQDMAREAISLMKMRMTGVAAS